MKKIIIYVYALLFSTFASAESIFTHPPTDKLDQIFGAMFGGLGVFGTNGSNPFTAQLQVLNEALLVFAGIITAYLVLNWIIKTAHEGETGKTAAGAWHLIRYVIACASIIPVPTLNGYTTAQLLVAKPISIGISFAYNTANYAFNATSMKEIATSNLSLQKVDSVAHNLFLSAVCVNAYEDFYKQNTFANSSGNQVPKFGITTEKGIFTDDIHFGQVSKFGQYEKDTCGTYSIHRYESNRRVVKGSNYDSDVIDGLISVNNGKLAAKLFNDVNKLAKEFMTKRDLATYQKAIDAGAEYSKNSREYAFNLVKNDTKIEQMLNAVKVDGSLYVGAYYMRITDLQSKTNAAIARIPSATGIKKIDPSLSSEIFSQYIQPINGYVNQLNSPMATFGINTINGNQDSSWWEGIKASVKGDPNVILKKMISSGTEPFIFNEKDNLVTSMQSLGAWALAFTAALTMTTGFIVLFFGIHNGVTAFSMHVLELFGTPLGIFGSALLFITPMIPFYVYIGAMITWICSATATILIANFIPVCMMFAGSNSMGQASNAFKQLLSIVFKPSLLVISFTAAIVLTNLLGQAIMPIFMSVWNLSQDNSSIVTYLFSLLFMIASYSLFGSYLILQINLICHKLPDQMISFLGGSGTIMSGEASSFGAAGGSFAGGLAGGAIGSSIKSLDEMRKKNEEMDEKGSTSALKNKAMGNTSPSGSGDSGASGGVAGRGKNANSLSSAMNASSAGDSSDNELDADNENKHSFEDFNIDDYEDLNKSTKDNQHFEPYQSAYDAFKNENPNATETEAKFYATDSAISWKYGAGAGKAVAAAGGGSYNNDDAKFLYKMYDTASISNFKRSELKNISKEINDNNLKGDEALQSFSKNFAKIQNKKIEEYKNESNGFSE
ncbi:DotA/TraY family protein [Delftia tsuruhatensis]|uniref:DotA/TraY family protein n=1 Tax=Delftia tsuruhatensis TaxID=180282 RepID=UPI0008F079D6|nr:DotA/TraY family protein [Delftia tsuruhatensis]SFB29101.1 conjugal transfer/type IV secretion protein DotA/TraY [Delftia tsuruhatensis]